MKKKSNKELDYKLEKQLLLNSKIITTKFKKVMMKNLFKSIFLNFHLIQKLKILKKRSYIYNIQY